jgi:hypothetical protein
MAIGESAGAVYVTIDGDSSPLLAKYAQAEAQSRAAGQKISSALGAGLQSGTGLVDQFGRAIQSAVAPTAELAAAIKEVGVSASSATTTVTEAAGASEALAVANTHATTEIQATSGALRTLDGNGGIRAAERFLATTLGLGGVFQAIFPIVGLIALVEIVGKIADKFGNAKEQSQEFSAALKETNQAAQSLVDTLDSINVSKIRDQFGGAAGERAQAAVLEQQSLDRLAEASALRAKIAEAKKVENPVTELFGKPLDIEATTEKIKALSLQAQELAERSAEMERHANQVTGPQEAAEAARKAAEERKQQIADQKKLEEDAARQSRAITQSVYFARRQAAEEERRTTEENTRDMLSGLREASAEDQRIMDEQRRAQQAADAEANRRGNEGIRAAGVRQQSDDEIAKLKLQQTYSLQIFHTRQDELNYAIEIASADEQALQHKIDELQTLRDYQAITGQINELNSTDLEIERARAALKKQQLVDQSKVAAALASPLARQLTRIGTGIPGQIGGAFGAGLFRGNLGGSLAGAAKNTGQEVVSSLMTAAIRQLIVKMGLQTAATALLSGLTGTHTGVLAANTVGTTANTGATLAGTISTIANTVSTDLNTFWLAIKGILGGFFAAGGRPPTGLPSVVGERGPELFIPDTPGTIIPNIPSAGIGATPLTSSTSVSSASSALTVGAIHLHGVRDVRDVARRLPAILKATAPNFSPATR